MKPKAILTIAAMLLVFAVPTALGVTFQESHLTGAVYLWQDTQNWVGGAVPTAGQQAVIPTDCTATVRGTADICGYLDVQGTGEVVIEASATLTIDGNGTARTSTLDPGDKIFLAGASAILYIKDDNHTFSPGGGSDGVIVGQSNTAQILIDSTVTLTINDDVSVDGATKITGGTFVNDGTVRADDATSGTQDTLLFDSGTVMGTGSFVVNQAGATMKFNAGVTATAIWGDLTISNGGTLDCWTQVAFLQAGCFNMAVGEVKVRPEGTFEAH